MAEPNQIDIRAAFVQRQRLLAAQLQLPLDFTKHPTTLGDATEANWKGMLGSFLPGRYAIGPIFAMDANGNQSDQIDLGIYDRQYSPLWLEVGSSRIVPVESVYAALEVKPEVSAATLKYAADKVASVRRLQRRSGKIVDIAGTHAGPLPANRPILGGIVALRSSWNNGFDSDAARSRLAEHTGESHLDVGLALEHTAFDNVPTTANLEMLTPGVDCSTPGTQLIFFALRLFRRLQSIGTAMAVDLDSYDRLLEDLDPADYPDPADS
ncbi:MULTISPECIES: DUF6602 domain-containing protein [Curtobacterium]|uniref:DUF6602 domain-containing protein n=1 Tax=Curtobacterium TaxID=2034 RepID=UPI00217DD532|nr:DUF6602 domain-containing protein [Curtobacterium flaccumfaciens]MCS6562301.1 hypothetical protein [Curtobacterium flaccumfaciens pv. poinsettiae]UXN28370.1 hypothetical protein N8D75_15425 [Curtobacterium flaccumfaciens]